MSGLQPWFRQRLEYADMIFRYYTGGQVSRDGKSIVGGIQVPITSTLRSRQEQERLYANRASNPNPVNRPGDSAHEWGVAADTDPPEHLWPLWKAICEYVGFRVVIEKTAVHVEWPDWRSLRT